jgi:site-specific recombinase XerD
MKASLTFFPQERKKNKKTGRIPIYMRICFLRAKAESRLNIEIDLENLTKWDPFTMRITERNCAINHYLNRIEQKFQDFLILNSTCLPKFSAANIKSFVLGEPVKTAKLMTFVDNYFVNTIVKDVNRKPGTVKNYRRAVNHLVRFLGFKNLKNMNISDLDYGFASDFKVYLVSTIATIDKAGMDEVSAGGIIKKFRTIFNHAVDLELINKNPFKLIKIKTKSPRRERLSIQHIRALIEADLSNYPPLQVHRDIFLFSSLTGLAYMDSMLLCWRNLESKENENIKLSFCRQKSDILTESFLPTLAITIAKKYSSHIKNGEMTVLPKRSNKEINSQLKVIAVLASIPIRLTTHVARHTFRQLIAEADVSDYGVIKRMMGHSRRSDIDDVYYSITDSRLLDAKNKFECYLKKNLMLKGDKDACQK